MSSKRFFFAVLLCGFIALLTLGLPGCSSSSSKQPIGVALSPNSTQSIDQAQTVSITVSVSNDSKNAGVTWTVSGGGTLSAQTTTSATYNTPASVTSGFTATVTATSITDTTKSAVLQIKVSALPTVTTTSSSLPTVTPGTAYSATLAESGGTSPFTWSITSGTLPPGLSLAPSTGIVSGMPTGGGSGTVTFQVTDSSTAGKMPSGPAALTFTVNPVAAMNILPATLPGATIGTPYNVTMSVTGGIAPFAWSLTNNPSWLSINPSSGVLSGTPTGTSGGTASFFVWVTDSETPTTVTSNSGRSIAISVATLQVTTTSLPAATVGTAYSATVTATGGIPPYTWSLSGQPSWLSINAATGVLAGTPTTAGTTPAFTVSVIDSEAPPQQASATNLSITVNAQAACSGNSLLSGNYAVLLSGWKGGATRAKSYVGSFTADGAGNISSGTMDIADQGHSAPETDPFTGTYCVGSNNLATLTLNSGGNTVVYEAALDSVSGGVSSNGHIIEYDTTGELNSGILRKQDTSAFSTGKITGNYAFGYVGVDPSDNRFALSGQFSSDGSGNLSGVYDADDAGTLQTDQTLTSNDLTVASTGRGTVTITNGTGSLNYVFYVVSASEALVMAVDTSTPPTILAGQALQQTGTFTDASLDGVSVYETQGFDIKNTPATPEAIVGLVTTTGTAGTFTLSDDINDGGTVGTGSDSGTYSVSSNGRVTVTGTGKHEPVLYLIGQNQAFVVGTNGAVDFGTMTPQSGSNFTNASLSGLYMGGTQQPVYDNTGDSIWTEVGSGNADGNGNLTVTGYQNNSETGLSSGSSSLTYTVSSTGRVVVLCGTGNSFCTAGSPAAIMYMISDTEAVWLDENGNDYPKLTDFHQ